MGGARNGLCASCPLRKHLTDRSQLTVRDAINSALDEELARDDRVYVLGEEVRTASAMHCS